MDIGVFIPIGNYRRLVPTAAPQYTPSHDLNRRIAQDTESYGLEISCGVPAELMSTGTATSRRAP